MALTHLPTPSNPSPPAATVRPAAASEPGYDSRELMRGSREVLIRHANQTYRLRHTRNDKLILVK